MTKYITKITALNADKIGVNPHGTAEFTENGDKLHIKVEMFDTPKNIEHWEHFHGFPDGRDAQVPTMVPLDSAPEDMNIPHDGYPVADENGHYEYEVDVPLDKLQAKFKEAFGSTDLQLDKRVVYVHGVPADLKLPDSVKGDVMSYDAHTTLPIAAGKIVKA